MPRARTVRAEPVRLACVAADCALPLARLRTAVEAYRVDLAAYRAGDPCPPSPPARGADLEQAAARLEDSVAVLVEAAEGFARAEAAPVGTTGSPVGAADRVLAGAELGVGGLDVATQLTAARLTEDHVGPTWRGRGGAPRGDHGRRGAAAASRALPWAARATGTGTLLLPGVEQVARDARDPTLSGGVRTARAGAAVTLDGGLGLAGGAAGAKLGVAGTAKAGAALGSVVPGLGTAVGAIVGGTLGALALGTAGRGLRESGSGLVDATGRRLDLATRERGSASVRRDGEATPGRPGRRARRPD